MKKITLFIAALAMSVMSYALNPFAYALSSSLSEDGATLTVKYSLNAAATAVNVVVLDGEEIVKTVDCSAKGLVAGAYTAEIATEGLPTGKNLTWKVEVKGTSVTAPTQEEKNYGFYCPHGLAIDTNPESDNFGRIIVAEGMHGNKGTKSYVSHNAAGVQQAGLYTFNPSFTTDSVLYTGGLDFTRIWASNGYQPWRVKISEDGRIFVSSLDLNGVAVWEVSKDLKTWTPVIAGTQTEDGTITDADGNFLAGMNVSMDVKGSGENLTLLLYSCTTRATAFALSAYRLDEYALGTATTFTGTPKNIVTGGYAIVHTNAEFIYDGEGGYWFGASRSNSSGTPAKNLAHINAEGVEDYSTTDGALYGGDGVLVHNGMLFKGKARTSSTVGNFGVWTIGKDADGKVTLTEKWTVSANGIGRNLNEFAVDYAENLYVVGNSGEMIIAYALPYSGEVETPAAAKYAFEVKAAEPANTPLVCTDATVATEGQNITISADWGERPLTINLWQGGATQGFGTYAAADYDGYALNPWVQLTAVGAGVYTDNGDDTFTFTATMTDGKVTYDVKMSGSLAASAKIDMELECSNLKIVKNEMFYTFTGTSDMYSIELNLFATEYGEYKAQEIEGEMDYPIMGVVAGEACKGEGVYSYSEELGSDLLVAIVNVPTLQMTLKITMYGKTIVATDTIVVENMAKEIVGRGYLQNLILTGKDAKYGDVQFTIGQCDGSYGTYPAVYGTIDTLEVVGEGTWMNADSVDVLEAYLSTDDGKRVFKVTASTPAAPVVEPINIEVYDAVFTSEESSLSVTGVSEDNKKIALTIYDWIGYGEYDPYTVEGSIDDTIMVANLEESAVLYQEGNVATLEVVLNDMADNVYNVIVVGMAPAAPVADTITVVATNMVVSQNQWDDNLRLQAKDAEGTMIDIVLFEGKKTGHGDYNYPAGSMWPGIESARYGDIFLALNKEANFAKYYPLGDVEVFEGIFNDEDSGDVYIIKIATSELPTSIDNIKVNTNNSKVIENGKLFIINDNTKYNANGAVVK